MVGDKVAPQRLIRRTGEVVACNRAAGFKGAARAPLGQSIVT
jgi:hypothetical protein